MRKPHILIFDSGAGGLSVGIDIINKLCGINITYLADNKHFPYGTSNESSLFNIVINTLTVNINKFKPDLVVIACNTVSTLLLPELRAKFDIPFVGVVPAIKPAAQISKSGFIAVLATEQTVARDYTKNLIADFAAKTHVLLEPASQLVSAAENLVRHQLDPSDSILTVLNELKNQPNFSKVDTLVLACTHFPILSGYIQKILPNITLIDSGQAIANRVESLLYQNKAIPNARKIKNKQSTINVVLTQPLQELEIAYKNYLAPQQKNPH